MATIAIAFTVARCEQIFRQNDLQNVDLATMCLRTGNKNEYFLITAQSIFVLQVSMAIANFICKEQSNYKNTVE